MTKKVFGLDFYPPVDGIYGSFNTFRLGIKWGRELSISDDNTLMLFNSKTHELIGNAKVVDVKVGKLADMAQFYAQENHNHRHKDKSVAVDDLITSMQKKYGPHKCKLDSKVSVIFMELIEECQKPISQTQSLEAIH